MLRSFALAMAARAVRRCDRFPTAFRKPPPALPDAGSGSTACAAGRSVQPTWASLLIFLRSCQRAMETRFFGITLQPISLRRDAIGFRSAGSIAPCGYASSPQAMLFTFLSRLCRSAKPFPDRRISTRFALRRGGRRIRSQRLLHHGHVLKCGPRAGAQKQTCFLKRRQGRTTSSRTAFVDGGFALTPHGRF